MRDTVKIDLGSLVDTLRSAGETTRMRILALLRDGDLTVKDLTQILNQSQPRVSRHLKLLAEARLIERFPEGSWVYYRLSESVEGQLVQDLLDKLDVSDGVIRRDFERLEDVKAHHAEAAARFFADAAADWDAIRSRHISEVSVESAIRELLGDRTINRALDIGTGTGRILELLSDLYVQGVGIDSSLEMLGVARANLKKAGIAHAQVRYGDIFSLPVSRNSFDLATVHQVLHFLDDPAKAIREIAQALRPGGRLLIVDFAPHQLEFLRETQAHRRLGFSEEQMAKWIEESGLDLVSVSKLSPSDADDQMLTVSIWLAEDPRILIAGEASSSHLRTETV